jgi:hypothetical protein
MNRAIELGRIEQELYRKINCLDDQSSIGLYLDYAERLMDVLLKQFHLMYDGTIQTVYDKEAVIVLRRLDEMDELADKIEGLRHQADKENT